MAESKSKTTQDLRHPLLGKTVTVVRMMTAQEMEGAGWDGYDRRGATRLIEFSDGSKVFASADPEGNGPGCLYGFAPDGTSVYI